MKIYTASTNINASPDVIWKILTRASDYPRWDSSMDHIEGRLALGETVKFHTRLNTQAFPVKVTSFEPNSRMVLTGGMPLGLFKSVRTHTLTANPDGTTMFKTEEIFSGLLLPLFGKNIPDLTGNFTNFAESLRKWAEKA